jgi:hypothetical protein
MAIDYTGGRIARSSVVEAIAFDFDLGQSQFAPDDHAERAARRINRYGKNGCADSDRGAKIPYLQR